MLRSPRDRPLRVAGWEAPVLDTLLYLNVIPETIAFIHKECSVPCENSVWQGFFKHRKFRNLE